MAGFLCSPSAYLLVAAFMLVALAAYAALGLQGAIVMRDRGWVARELCVLAMFGVAALIAYLLFWLYLWKPAVGRMASVGALLLASVSLLDTAGWRRIRMAWADADIRYPVLLTIFIGLFYLGVTYGGIFPRQACAATEETFVLDRLLGTGSPDYLIQKIWADGLYRGSPPWDYMLDPDLSRTTVADRPPLLGAMALLLYPLMPESIRFLGFMAATTAASLSWVGALWALLRVAGLNPARSALAALAVSQTYYFWFSSIFTWPKALSGALVVGCVLVLLRPAIRGQPNRSGETIVAAAAGGLGMIGHLSAALLLLVMGMFLLHPRLFPGWRTSAVAAAVFAAIAGSYLYAKSTFESNTSNQTKYTLSVPDTSPVEPKEYKGISTAEAVRRAYAKISFAQAIENKIYNLRGVFRMGCFLDCGDGTIKEALWGSELLPILGSMKLFNAGWLLFVLPFALLLPLPDSVRAILRRVEPDAELRKATTLYVTLAAAGLFIYGLVSFRQGVSNILSAGFMLLLFGAVAARLFALEARALWLFVAAPTAYFVALVYGIGSEDRVLPNGPALVLLLVAVTGLAALAVRAAMSELRHQHG